MQLPSVILLGLLTVSAITEAAHNNNTTAACTLGTATGCTTEVVKGLTYQILDELDAMGYSFSTVDPAYIKCSGACVDRLQTQAAAALTSAARAKKDYITLNSAVRSSAQQYLLYDWYLTGQCSIGLAAKPGTSNHEGGRAVDTSYYDYWLTTFESYGWIHSYPDSDPVHFDYLDAQDLAQQNLKAFQRLYNRNTGSSIAEDGLYGADTDKALSASPCDGW
jgi:hypothetical protein